NGLRDAGQQCDIAPERQPLVADLRGGRVDDVADALRRDLRIPPQQLAHDLHRHVVGARLPEDALWARTPESRPHAVDEHELPTLHLYESTQEASSFSRRSSSSRPFAGNASRWNWIRSAPPVS